MLPTGLDNSQIIALIDSLAVHLEYRYRILLVQENPHRKRMRYLQRPTSQII